MTGITLRALTFAVLSFQGKTRDSGLHTAGTGATSRGRGSLMMHISILLSRIHFRNFA